MLLILGCVAGARMFLDRASFQGEGVLLRLLDRRVQVKVRQQLAAAWAREILWRRAGEAGGACQEGLLERLLSLPVEQLIQKCWVWYEPLMFGRVDGMSHERLLPVIQRPRQASSAICRFR